MGGNIFVARSHFSVLIDSQFVYATTNMVFAIHTIKINQKKQNKLL